jgi:hypothetical protein
MAAAHRGVDVETPGSRTADRVEAHFAVTALIYEYSRLVDRGDFDAVGELFARGTYAFAPDRVSTGAEVGERLRRRLRLYDEGTPRTVHANPNIVVSFNGDLSRAEARSPVQVFQLVAGEIKCIYLGHYEDAFETDGAEWYFTSRTPINELVGDMSAHVVSRPSPDAPSASGRDRT